MRLLKNNYRKRTYPQGGFTLIELMISMLIGLVAIGAAGALFLSSLEGNSTIMRSARLTSDLDSLLSLMANDIRRAGYTAAAVSGWDPDANPNAFTTATSDIVINGSCILYTYDGETENGSLDADEYYGFKLITVSDVGRVYMRNGASGDCTANSDVGWSPITLSGTNEAFTVTSLVISDTANTDSTNFPSQDASSKCINTTQGTGTISLNRNCSGMTPSPTTGDTLTSRRVINIRITALSIDEPNLSLTLGSSILVANDRIFDF